MWRLVLPSVLLAWMAGPSAGVGGDGPPESLHGITSRQLGGHLRFVASDTMGGRDTASEEIRIVGQYLAAQLQRFGAEPMGTRERGQATYFQPFPLLSAVPDPAGTFIALERNEGESRRALRLQPKTDFVLYTRGLTPQEIEAPVVFAGHGIVSEPHEIDDYAGLEVKNRIVVVLDGAPADAPRDKRGEFPPSRFRAKRKEAQERGALAVLVVRSADDSKPPFAETHAFGNSSFERPALSLGEAPSALPFIYLENRGRDFLWPSASLQDGTTRGPIPGVRARFAFSARLERLEGRNVIGLFRGSDPERAREVVIYSAHYDHIGRRENGDIYNGADDNGSGTSGLLEIAEAFGAAPRPARSVAFLWVSGEEKGLLGSQYFVDHMTLEDGMEVVANINMDMIGRNDPGRIGVTPSPRHERYNTLARAATEACALEELVPTDDMDSFFGRTDSYNFAERGIPVVFFFSGLHADYHKPTDVYEKIDLEKAARVARMAFRLGWQVANDPTRPAPIEPEAESPVRRRTGVF